MKILAIRGKNLASLEEEFELDFTVEPLRSAGIFAITGSTGSGKSTLLDALCLALFNDTPRTRIGENRISIQDVKEDKIAQTDTRTILRRGTADGFAEVDFISLGGERFRSRWSVKRAGNKIGGRLQNTEMRLKNLSNGVEEQGRKTDLLPRIVNLIGLTFEQFTRAVLLAQGDFATFLKAKESDKAELLEKLTGTDIYSRISIAIFENSKEADRELKNVREKIQDISILNEDELASYLSEKKKLEEEQSCLNRELTKLGNKIGWLEQQKTLHLDIERANEAYTELRDQIEQSEPRYVFISQIDKTQEIRDVYNDLVNVKNRLDDNRVKLANQRIEKEAVTRLLQEAEKSYLVCKKDEAELGVTAEHLEPQITEARKIDVQLTGARANANDAYKALDITRLAKNESDKHTASTEQKIRLAQEAAQKLSIWFDNSKSYANIIPNLDLILRLLKEAQIAGKEFECRTKGINDGKLLLDNMVTKRDQLKQEIGYWDNLLPAEIAALRAKLSEGKPCPVCGSLHHPVPPEGLKDTHLQGEEITQKKDLLVSQIEALNQKIELQKTELIQLNTLLGTSGNRRAELINEADTYLSVIPAWEDLFEQCVLQDKLSKFAEQWKQKEESLSKQQSLTNELKATLASARSDGERLNVELSERTEKQTMTQKLLEDLERMRAKILDGKSADEVSKSLAQKRKELVEKLNQSLAKKDELKDRQKELEGGIIQLEEQMILLKDHCEVLQRIVDNWIASKNGEITTEALIEYLSKDMVWVNAERQFLDNLKSEETKRKATLDERKDKYRIHLESALRPTSEMDTTQSLNVEVNDRSIQLKKNRERNTAIDVVVATHWANKERRGIFEKNLEEKESLASHWAKLNDLLGSAKGEKFKIIAQAYTLDVLLEYANKHLKELSKRYELQRNPETLALLVVDLDMFGEIRAVHSLSGGESFLISLALALGLSSLSSNRLKIESLFIDEGFGSLDIDTLRVAMDALGELQTQGRKIGVISHVPEMTERIATQIQVVKTANGRSKIQIIS